MPDKRLNILLISSWYPTRIAPTLGNFVEKHAESVALYANVNVLHVTFDSSINKSKEYTVEKKNNVIAHCIYLKKSKTSLPLITATIRLFRIIHNYYIGYKQIFGEKVKPDIIHANILFPVGLIAYLFMKTKKIPYIITEHWTGYLRYNTNTKIKFLFLQKIFTKNAAAIVPVTNNLAEAMKSFSIRGNYITIPNVVDTALFIPANVKSNTIKHILHISTLDDKQKNFSGIINALQELIKKRDDFILDIISEGNYEQFLPQIKAAGLENKIILHGLKKTAQVAAIMRQCDFLLLFSNYENFPCVIAEALSCGLPVLSTDVGGIAEHVNEKMGILINKGDTTALILQLDNLLDNYRNYDKNFLSSYAKNKFSYEVVGKQYVELYNKILKNN